MSQTERIATSRYVAGVGLSLLMAVASGCVSQPVSFRANTTIDPSRYPVECEGDFDEAPQLASGKVPVYPVSMLDPTVVEDRKTRHLPMEWLVESTFTVSPDGSTQEVASTATTPASFGQHMTIAVRTWRFVPAKASGAAVPAQCTAAFKFTLD